MTAKVPQTAILAIVATPLLLVPECSSDSPTSGSTNVPSFTGKPLRPVSSVVFHRLAALQDPRSSLLLERRAALLAHPVYARLGSLPALRTLMEHHVWAVWDFMSLLKSIQAEVAPVSVPWRPPRDGESARLINEIVVGEECDEAPGGGYTSHFSLYLRAMERAGADRGPIDHFLAQLDAGATWEVALDAAEAPTAAKTFVTTTLRLTGGSLSTRVAAFTVGREEIIPDMFRDVVARLSSVPTSATASDDVGPLRHYLERHIEVDGDRHGPMSARLFERVCLVDDASRVEAFEAGAQVLGARLALWSSIAEAICARELATTD